MHSKRVVICDDEGIAQLHLARSLQRAGWVVVGQAVSGEQAVEIVLKERPDIVLMDFSMMGLNGLEASRLILSDYPVCIILLTGHDRADFEDAANEIGISGCLSKPVTGEALIEAIPSALEQFYAQSNRVK